MPKKKKLSDKEYNDVIDQFDKIPGVFDQVVVGVTKSTLCYSQLYAVAFKAFSEEETEFQIIKLETENQSKILTFMEYFTEVYKVNVKLERWTGSKEQVRVTALECFLKVLGIEQ